MKPLTNIKSIILGLFILISSCSKVSNSSPIGTIVQQGSWRVTQYIDSGKDETSDFIGYVFVFNSNGTAVATRSGVSVNGTWSTTSSSSGNTKMILNFGPTKPLDELNDDWTVIEKTTNKIRLEDVSGGGSGTDYLTFEKN